MSSVLPEGARWCTFIGGCADGERLLIRDDVEFWEKVEHPPAATLLSHLSEKPVQESHLTLYRYRRHILVWHRQPIHVFVWEGIPDDAVLPALIGGYRRGNGQH